MLHKYSRILPGKPFVCDENGYLTCSHNII